jgi:hypothetical protein
MLGNAMATKKKIKKASKTKSVSRAPKPKRAAKRKAALAPKRAPAKKASGKKASAKKASGKKAPAKKAAAKKRAPAKKATPKKARAKKLVMQRRDGGGHLDPKYAAMLREKSREGRVRDSDDAFVGRTGHSKDALAEELGEAWVETATSGEDENEEVLNQDVPEDAGGPFVTTTGEQEFAAGTDASNPKRAKREPFPTT